MGRFTKLAAHSLHGLTEDMESRLVRSGLSTHTIYSFSKQASGDPVGLTKLAKLMESYTYGQLLKLAGAEHYLASGMLSSIKALGKRSSIASGKIQQAVRMGLLTPGKAKVLTEELRIASKSGVSAESIIGQASKQGEMFGNNPQLLNTLNRSESMINNITSKVDRLLNPRLNKLEPAVGSVVKPAVKAPKPVYAAESNIFKRFTDAGGDINALTPAQFEQLNSLSTVKSGLSHVPNPAATSGVRMPGEFDTLGGIRAGLAEFGATPMEEKVVQEILASGGSPEGALQFAKSFRNKPITDKVRILAGLRAAGEQAAAASPIRSSINLNRHAFVDPTSLGELRLGTQYSAPPNPFAGWFSSAEDAYAGYTRGNPNVMSEFDIIRAKSLEGRILDVIQHQGGSKAGALDFLKQLRSAPAAEQTKLLSELGSIKGRVAAPLGNGRQVVDPTSLGELRLGTQYGAPTNPFAGWFGSSNPVHTPQGAVASGIIPGTITPATSMFAGGNINPVTSMFAASGTNPVVSAVANGGGAVAAAHAAGNPWRASRSTINALRARLAAAKYTQPTLTPLNGVNLNAIRPVAPVAPAARGFSTRDMIGAGGLAGVGLGSGIMMAAPSGNEEWEWRKAMLPLFGAALGNRVAAATDTNQLAGAALGGVTGYGINKLVL